MRNTPAAEVKDTLSVFKHNIKRELSQAGSSYKILAPQLGYTATGLSLAIKHGTLSVRDLVRIATIINVNVNHLIK